MATTVTQGTKTSAGVVNYNPNTGAKLSSGQTVSVNPGNSTVGAVTSKGSAPATNINNFDPNTGRKLNPGETVTAPDGRKVTQGTPFIAASDLGSKAPAIPTTPVDTKDYSPILASMRVAEPKNIVDESTNKQASMFDEMLKELAPPPSTEDIYAKTQKELGIKQKEQAVNDYSGQLNQIITKAEADKLSLVGQGRGIVEPIIGGIQNQIGREAAIAALPVKAALDAAQGSLEMAQHNLDTLFTIRSQDAQAQYQYKNNLVKSVYTFASEQEKTKLDYALKIEDRKHAEEQQTIQQLNQLSMEALKVGAPASLISKIGSAKTVGEAMSLPGVSGYLGADHAMDMKVKNAQLSNIYSEIAKRNADSKPVSVVTPPVVNPNTGKIDPANQLAAVLSNPKVKDNAKLQDINGVIAATQQFAEENSSGKFAGTGILGGTVQGMFLGKQATANRSSMEAINLKVQQWASGAALTAEQTKQVGKITPRPNDTQAQIRNKTNALTNFMLNQAKGILTSQGIPYTPEKIDYFKPIVKAPDGTNIQITD